MPDSDFNKIPQQPTRAIPPVNGDATSRMPGPFPSSPQDTQGFTAQFAPQVPQASQAPQTPRAARGFKTADQRFKTQQKPPKRNRKRNGLIALAVIGGLLIVAYAGGVVAFSNIFYPNTSIADVDVSLMNRETAAARVSASVTGYKLTVEGDGFEWTYEPASADELIDADKRAEQLLAQNAPFTWPVRLVRALAGDADTANASNAKGDVDATDLPAAFDEEAFIQSITAAVDAYNEGKSGTFDGASAFDAEAGAFSPAKARSNIRLNRDAVAKLAKTALAQLDTTAELNEDCYEPLAGGATEEDIQTACDAANKLIGRTITLTMAGTAAATIDSTQLAQYVSFNEKLEPSLNTDAVIEWLKAFTSEQMDTVGLKRTYTRADGKSITVEGGTFGWNVNSAELVKQVNDALSKEGDATIEVPTHSAGDRFTKRGERDWNAYIDVDLSEQYVRYYDDADKLIWESGCITGNPNEGNDTPTGVYAMNQCIRGITLIGKDDPETGKPIYETPVDYWMPFVGGAVGFHDASWQAAGNFGVAGIEYSVGSHGCVNLPPAKAAELFGMVHTGLCVVVHN